MLPQLPLIRTRGAIVLALMPPSGVLGYHRVGNTAKPTLCAVALVVALKTQLVRYVQFFCSAERKEDKQNEIKNQERESRARR